MLNVPVASEAVAMKNRNREKSAVAIERQPVSHQLEAMPLFERPDFESLLNPLPSNAMYLPPVGPSPVEIMAPPASPESSETDVQELDGIVVSRSKLTWIAVAVAALLMVSFTIGYFLATATVPAKKPAKVLNGCDDVHKPDA